MHSRQDYSHNDHKDIELLIMLSRIVTINCSIGLVVQISSGRRFTKMGVHIFLILFLTIYYHIT
jgi:hypothetical protein